jgi:hypothetical protein
MSTPDPYWCELHERRHPVPSMTQWCRDQTEPEWGLVVEADEKGHDQFPDPFTPRLPA